ncbi:uncharacterized protein LOC141617178 [Silene latifolia]|uniref:uncharacterized protein LOC141617178 n=1 Tax=Silene latifolia TaxID=37657 RepID=UPI003D77699C
MARGRPPRAGEPPAFTTSVDNSIVAVKDVTDEPVPLPFGKAPQTETASDSGTKKTSLVGTTLKTYSQVLKNSSKGMNLSFFPVVDSSVNIEEEDIVKEVEYWKTTLMGTVLGRFASAEDMEKIRSDTWNVNGFPLVFKSWSPTVVDELNVTHVPVWVLFHNLDPCFWSKAGLSKVASAVGNPICADEHTTNKSKLAFARILIDVGYTKDRCNPAGKPKAKAKTVYRPKQPKQSVESQQVVDVPSSSTTTGSPQKTPEKKKSPVKKTAATKLSNRFSALQDGNLIEPVPPPESVSGVASEVDSGGEHTVCEVEDKVQEAHQFLLDNKVECGALIETHVKHTTIKDVSSRFSHYQLVHNNDMHYNGRIWIFWNPVAVALTVLHKSAQHIHCSLLHIASQKHIEVTFVYAFNARLDRRGIWTHLQSISSQVSVPWLCFGDFNVVLNMDERLGSSHVQLADMAEFSQWAKLDRVLASPQWFASRHSTATFLNAGVSDQSPCLVNVDGMASPCRSNFKYLNCWALSPQFRDTVHRGWSSYYYGGHIVSLFQKLKRLKSGLRKLHTSSFTNLTDKVATCKSTLKHCQDKLSCSPLDSTLLREEKVLVQEYLQVKKAEMQVLYQRAKVQHIQLGDLSTEYFYSKISARKVRNNIGSILDEAGRQCTGSHEVAQGFLAYYNSLLGTSTSVLPLPSHLFLHDTVPPKCYSKILANRLKQVLDSIFGPEHAAFVADRDIFDNTMLAHKLVSKYGRAYLTPRCLLKVDIRKAFDSVNWTFLKDYMLYLNFPSVFVDWIMACITSPHYSLLINGEVQGFFPGKCGLRGDLASVKAVADCLDLFSTLSGLAVNLAKTDLYFGGVAADIKTLILATTGFSEGQSIWSAKQTISNSWYWNNVVKMKDLLLGLAGSPSLALQLLERCTSHMRYDTNVVYDLVRIRRAPVTWHSFVHGKGCHPKYSFTGLMVMTDSLPTVAKLITRGLHLVNRCVLCKCCMEDLHHVFFNCPYFRSGKQKACLMASFYFIRKERNSRIFQGTKSSTDSLCIVIKRPLKMPPKKLTAYIQATEMTVDEVARKIEQQDTLLDALKNMGNGGEKPVDATHLSTIIARFNPSTYEGTEEPKLLDNWHREMESLLEVVKCSAELAVEQVA